MRSKAPGPFTACIERVYQEQNTVGQKASDWWLLAGLYGTERALWSLPMLKVLLQGLSCSCLGD